MFEFNNIAAANEAMTKKHIWLSTKSVLNDTFANSFFDGLEDGIRSIPYVNIPFPSSFVPDNVIDVTFEEIRGGS